MNRAIGSNAIAGGKGSVYGPFGKHPEAYHTPGLRNKRRTHWSKIRMSEFRAKLRKEKEIEAKQRQNDDFWQEAQNYQ